MTPFRSIVVTGAFLFTACTSDTHEGVQMVEAWSRPAGEGANGAVYLTVSNQDSVPLHIDSVSTPQATAAELHETTFTDGVSRMVPLTGVDIPPRGRLQMEPGGVHVMLVELKQPMNAGDSLPIALFTSNGNVVNGYVHVRTP